MIGFRSGHVDRSPENVETRAQISSSLRSEEDEHADHVWKGSEKFAMLRGEWEFDGGEERESGWNFGERKCVGERKRERDGNWRIRMEEEGWFFGRKKWRGGRVGEVHGRRENVIILTVGCAPFNFFCFYSSLGPQS